MRRNSDVAQDYGDFGAMQRGKRNAVPSSPFEHLNRYVLLRILSYLDMKHLMNLALTSKFLHLLVHRDQQLWWNLAKSKFMPTLMTREGNVDWRALTLILTHSRLPPDHELHYYFVSTGNEIDGQKIHKNSSMQQNGMDVEDKLMKMMNVGMKCREFGFYTHAEKLFERVHHLSCRMNGEMHKRTADTLLKLSLSKGNQGKLLGENGAFTLAHRALNIYCKTVGEESAEAAEALYMLADIHYVHQEYEKALLLYQRAYEIRNKCFPAISEELAASHVGLGLIAVEMKEYQLAETHYLTALDIREKLHGRDHPKVAHLCVNLGAMYKERDELEKTVSLYRRALQIRERWLGTEHPRTVKVRKNLQNTEEQLALRGLLQ